MPPSCCQGMGCHVRLHSPCRMHLLRLGAGNVNCGPAPIFFIICLLCPGAVWAPAARAHAPHLLGAHDAPRADHGVQPQAWLVLTLDIAVHRALSLIRDASRYHFALLQPVPQCQPCHLRLTTYA